MKEQLLLQKAIRALKIDVPVVRYEVHEEGTLELYLYGGRILTWKEEPNRDGQEKALSLPALTAVPSSQSGQAPFPKEEGDVRKRTSESPLAPLRKGGKRGKK